MSIIDIFSFCRLLEENKRYFTFARQRDDSIMITFTVVGGRIEVDFFEDGHIEYSLFSGDESVLDDFQNLKQIIESKNT
jgi:hypothetical protein